MTNPEDHIKVDIDVASADTTNVIYLIPLDAPIPLELQEARSEQGPLLTRLGPLAEKELTNPVNVVTVSGAELLALARAWDYLVEHKNVLILTELPGARYDLIFDQARRQIGIRAVAWPLIETQLAESLREAQRTKDASPWHDTTKLMEEVEEVEPIKKAKGSNLQKVATALAEPTLTEEDLDED